MNDLLSRARLSLDPGVSHAPALFRAIVAELLRELGYVSQYGIVPPGTFKLMQHYGVQTVGELIEKQAAHVARLQDLTRYLETQRVREG